MNAHVPVDADVRPLTTQAAGRVLLEGVQIESTHPAYGHGRVYLTPDQLDYVHALCTTVVVVKAGDDDRHPCGAAVRHVMHEQAIEDTVQIEGMHPRYGHGELFLTPDQLAFVRGRLEQIDLTFLHDNAWGGEDARSQ